MDAAIAASLADVASGPVINEWAAESDRGSCARRDEHAPDMVSEGRIAQINTLDQHSTAFHALIESHNAPRSICGAFSCANALLIAERAAAGEYPETILASLQEMKVVCPEVKKAMKHFQRSRLAYIEAHKGDFPTEREAKQYVSAWAANYEISDYMKECAKTRDVSNIFFLRYNQWPERKDATHEEAQRLAEEEVFGGHNTGDKASVQLEPGASRFIVERFTSGGESVLERPEEWLARQESYPGAVFILDLNGHFAAAVAQGPLHEPRLVVVNTTRGDYIRAGGGDGCIPLVAFDLAYPGK